MVKRPSLYWWSPFRMPKSLVVESVRNASGWTHVIGHGGMRVSNFGDAVNPLIFEALVGAQPRWAPAARADFAMIGSVIETLLRAKSDALVFGSGLKDRVGDDPHVLRIAAVRGRLTTHALGLSAEKAVGDPGLVVRSLVRSTPASARRTRVVVIPHFSAPNYSDARRALAAARHRGAEVVMPNRHPLDVARMVSGAQLVLTSSLHAMVFADALGTPVQRVRFSGQGGEPEFKYQDYESIFPVNSAVMHIDRWLSEGISTSRIIDGLEPRSTFIRSRVEGVIDGIFSAGEILR